MPWILRITLTLCLIIDYVSFNCGTETLCQTIFKKKKNDISVDSLIFMVKKKFYHKFLEIAALQEGRKVCLFSN